MPVLLGRCGILPQTEVLAMEAFGHRPQEPLKQTLHRAPETLGPVRMTKGTFNMWIPRPWLEGLRSGRRLGVCQLRGPRGPSASSRPRLLCTAFGWPSFKIIVWMYVHLLVSLDTESDGSPLAQETTLVRERGE